MSDGYFDLQVNGFQGVDFNQNGLTAERLHFACEKLREGGVEKILATICSENIEHMIVRLRAIAEARGKDATIKAMVAGIHIEGPFFNEKDGFRGAHPLDAMRPADPDTMRRLLDAAGGTVKMVTLAPERDPGMKTIAMLVRQGITVSAGHCDASIDELNAAIDLGLRLFTHLGNGCPAQINRHDNIIQRVLSLGEKITPCFICDGAHIPFFALGNYLRAAGPERCIVVTDCIAPAGLGQGNFTIGRWKLKIGPDMVARAPDGSHLLGAVVTMRQSETNLRNMGFSPDICRKLLCENPRKAVKL